MNSLFKEKVYNFLDFKNYINNLIRQEIKKFDSYEVVNIIIDREKLYNKESDKIIFVIKIIDLTDDILDVYHIYISFNLFKKEIEYLENYISFKIYYDYLNFNRLDEFYNYIELLYYNNKDYKDFNQFDINFIFDFNKNKRKYF